MNGNPVSTSRHKGNSNSTSTAKGKASGGRKKYLQRQGKPQVKAQTLLLRSSLARLPLEVVQEIGRTVQKDMYYELVDASIDRGRDRQRDLSSLCKASRDFCYFLSPLLYARPEFSQSTGTDEICIMNAFIRSILPPSGGRGGGSPLHVKPLGSLVKQINLSTLDDRRTLERALRYMPHLQQLNVYPSSAMHNSTMTMIAKANPQITELDLGDCPNLTDACIHDLVCMKRLTSLQLYAADWLTDGRAKRLICELPNLVDLDMQFTGVTDVFVAWLIDQHEALFLGDTEGSLFPRQFMCLNVFGCDGIKRQHESVRFTIKI